MEKFLNNKHIKIAIAFFVFSSFAFSQEVFLSVSGKRANTKITGDELHQYDYWIKPEASTKNASLHIFDAAIGGVADIVIGAVETKTTFELIPFDALYKYSDGKLSVVAKNAKAERSITVTAEQQYLNRWSPFFSLPASENGWILRVRASEGDDVNSFQIAVSDSGTTIVPRNDWSIVTVDLSICLFRVLPGSEMQIRPFDAFAESLHDFKPYGEEQASIVLRDAFGMSTVYPAKKEFFKSTLPNGMKNVWGVSILGSAERINNVVLRGTKNPILWEYKPSVVRQPQKPIIETAQLPAQGCNSVQFVIAEASKKYLAGNTPIWSYGNSTIEKDTAEFDFSKAGKYSVSLFVPTRGLFFPKFWTQEIAVTVNAPPIAKITTDKTIAAPGDIVTLSAASSKDAENAPLKYSWYVNEKFRSDEQVLTLSSLIPTLYEVKLVVNDGATNSSCTESSATQAIRINAQPYADIQFRNIFGRTSQVPFAVKDDVDNDGDILEFTWNGPGIVGNNKGKSINIKHDKAGIYSLSLTTNDQTNTSNSTYTKTISYRVNAEPKPNFDLLKQSAPSDTISLRALVVDEDNPNVSFTWNSNAGHSLSGANVKLAFDQPGDYSITLTADDCEGVENSVQSITKEIHINAPPIPVITAELRSTSAKQKISAEKTTDDDNSDLIYTWNFGDGTTAVGKNQIHIYQQSGTYTITLTVDDKQKQTNSIQKTTHTITINKYPVAQFTLPKNWEPGKPLAVDGSKSFDADGTVEQFTWLINGKEAASGTAVSLIFNEPGDYAVALKVKDNSGFDDAIGIKSIPIHINYPPVVRWKMIPDVAEPNVPVTFDASASFDEETKPLKKVTWEFSDGTTAQGMKITKTFSKTGIIGVTAIVDDESGFGNSVQKLQGTILVNSSPIIVTKTFIRTNSRRILLDATQSYDVDKHAINFEWLLPDGSRVNKASFTWDAPSGGVHFITLTANDGQGRKNSITRETIKILVNRPPVAVVDSLIYSCTGQTILFNGSLSYDPDGDALSTKWDFDDGSNSSETNPAHVYKTPGYYTVKLLLDDGFAEQPTTATIPIIVEGSPIAVQTFTDTTICVNIPLDFSGERSTDPNGPIGSYAWEFGDGISALGTKVSHAYTKPGIYYATLTVVGSGSGRCSKVSQATATIRVIEGPTANFTMPERVSIGQLVTFNPSNSKPNGAVSSVTWKLGNETTMTFASLEKIQYAFRKAGTYNVEMTVRIQSATDCNSASFMKKIQVNDPPILVWNVPTDVALGDQLILDASKSYDNDGIITAFDWKIDGKKAGTTPIVTVANLTAGNHTVSLTITDNSATTSQSVSKEIIVRVNSKPNPTFTLPDVIYENELLTLKPASLVDVDGDNLMFNWTVNREKISADTIRLKAGRNSIMLSANDGRGVRNSADSVLKEYFVIAAPNLNIPHAEHWIAGTEINANKIFNSSVVNFIQVGNPVSTWRPTAQGKQTSTVVWMPKGQTLASAQFTITVWDSLKFTEVPAPQTITWNPSNPKIVLTAPAVNRPENAKLRYEWFKGKNSIGIGKVVEATVTQGKNIFTVRAIDQEIIGAHWSETEIVVICE